MGGSRAHEAIRRIAESALAAYEPGLGWRAHRSTTPSRRSTVFTTCISVQAGDLGAAASRSEWGDHSAAGFQALCRHVGEANRRLLADSQHGSASYLFGDAGLDLLHWTFHPNPALGQRLFDTVQGNLHNPVREALWGNPGTMLAAIHMAETTCEARWTALCARRPVRCRPRWRSMPIRHLAVGAEPVRSPARALHRGRPWFCRQRLPLLAGGGALPADQVALIAERALATLQATARHADGGANWFPGINPQRPANWLPPVQDCHGAPGISRLATAPRTPEWDTLLLQAGNLIWRAGPLSKGASLRHGTAGSGFAMLAVATQWRTDLARPRPRAGDARLWAGRAAPGRLRSRPSLTVDRRPGPGLPAVELHGRQRCRTDPRRVLTPATASHSRARAPPGAPCQLRTDVADHARGTRLKGVATGRRRSAVRDPAAFPRRPVPARTSRRVSTRARGRDDGSVHRPRR